MLSSDRQRSGSRRPGCRGNRERNRGRPFAIGVRIDRDPADVRCCRPRAERAGCADINASASTALRQSCRVARELESAFARCLGHLRALSIHHDATGARCRIGVRSDRELNGARPLPGCAPGNAQPRYLRLSRPLALALGLDGDCSSSTVRGNGGARYINRYCTFGQGGR